MRNVWGLSVGGSCRTAAGVYAYDQLTLTGQLWSVLLIPAYSQWRGNRPGLILLSVVNSFRDERCSSGIFCSEGCVISGIVRFAASGLLFPASGFSACLSVTH